MDFRLTRYAVANCHGEQCSQREKSNVGISFVTVADCRKYPIDHRAVG